jgi:hypothetical protein
MRRTVLFTAFALTIAGAAAAQPISAGALQFTTKEVGEIDTGKLKGEPSRLAWSPDGTTLYLQTVERDRFGNTKEYHYTMPAAGGEAKKVDVQPDWAARYWTWKSAPAAPGAPAFKFDIDTRRETRRATSAPTGGGLAGMGGDPTASGGGGGGRGSGGGTGANEAANVALQGQTAQITSLRLKGEVVGEFVNEPVRPGLTFGWAPQGKSAIAFADREGRLTVMDEQGGNIRVSGTDDVLLPAWSEDGKQLAFLEKDGRRKFKVKIASLDAK